MAVLAKNEIYRGDCVKRLAELSPGTVDLVFADPPFNIGYDYDIYDDKQDAAKYLTWCRQWIERIREALKPDGTFWLAIGDEFAAELKIIAQETGFFCRSWVIWYYTFGVNCAQGFSRSHTHLFHFVKDRSQFTFNGGNPKVRVRSARQLVYADGRANPKGRLPDNTWILRPQDAPHSFQPDHDTWYFARVAGTFKERKGFHGCQMPEQLLGRIIRVSSNPNELVVDPFAGSGTTLSVAKKLGRQWIGFELSADYVKRIRKRLQSVAIGDALDGPENPIQSAPTTAAGKRRKKQRSADELGAIVEAFQTTSRGYSADHLLCAPEMNGEFLASCRRLGVELNDTECNQTLLRLRKSKRLPKVTRERTQLSFRDMDPYSFASEIAMRLLAVDYDVTLDNILCSPDYVAEFDRIASEFAPGFSPFEYRWAALAIRKRAGLKDSKSLANEKFSDWLRKKLPRRVPLDRCNVDNYQWPGVYLVRTSSHQLYVGESENIGNRIQQMRDTPSWEELEPDSITVIAADSSDKHALQAVLVERTSPLLNSHLLRLAPIRTPK